MVQCKNSEASIILGDFSTNVGDERDEDFTGGHEIEEWNDDNRKHLFSATW